MARDEREGGETKMATFRQGMGVVAIVCVLVLAMLAGKIV